ncbi:probable G protein gamma subunit [Cephalotrichum gorgonifer]|uniref:Guanine nucleotide-binding protein subunit gamma n=1 Tax=Cephalotrichum gorgonifer TaxID=2041049 RepID=A0AAE8MXQ1_9PEZI|nr:probable G protein gamma subunit [Cephalotrichum gorgonifer]
MSPMQQYRPRQEHSSTHHSYPYEKQSDAGPKLRPAIPTSSFAAPIRAPPPSKPMMPQYTSRDVGDPSQIKKNKQSMADLKLRRLTELNKRLREDLERERIPVSSAAKSIIAYCNSTKDYMVPSVWGAVPKGDDPYAPQQSAGCCLVM